MTRIAGARREEWFAARLQSREVLAIENGGGTAALFAVGLGPFISAAEIRFTLRCARNARGGFILREERQCQNSGDRQRRNSSGGFHRVHQREFHDATPSSCR